MPRPSKGPRIFTRHTGGLLRYYGDFRSIGGGREALCPQGSKWATSDWEEAQQLFSDRLGELQDLRQAGQLGKASAPARATLGDFAATHLVKKAKSGRVTLRHMKALEQKLEAAIAFFGEDRQLASILVEDVEDYAHWLTDYPNGRGSTLNTSTQRKYLYALSNLLRRAQGARLYRGVNPVLALPEKPLDARSEAKWLEVWEGALLLESARTYPEYRAGGGTTYTLAARLRTALEAWGGPGEFALRRFQQEMQQRGMRAGDAQLAAYLEGSKLPALRFLQLAGEVLATDLEWLRNGSGKRLRRVPGYTYALVATFLLTGGREEEVYGLELADVSFRRKTVTFRPNRWRRLKTRTSHRTVPLWPQLERILEAHLDGSSRADSPLLFPSEKSGGMVHDTRKALDAIAKRVGWQPGEIRTKIFRHTYCAARLQTLDRGEPVSDYTVAREMGHGGSDLVRRVYGHLGRIRHRSELVEYHLEQHKEIPEERLQLLRVSAGF